MTKRYKVFLSSTARDLAPYRVAVHRALDQMEQVDPVWMKDWVSQSATSLDVCRRKVRESDIFVALIGHCFGSAPEQHPDRSYTMLEFDWAAEDPALPRLLHIATNKVTLQPDWIEDDHRRALQTTFRTEDTKGWHAGQRDSWNNPDRLATDVAEAVRQQIVRMEAATQAGFTEEKYEVSLLDQLADINVAIASSPASLRHELWAQRDDIKAKLQHIETAYHKQAARIAELEATLDRLGNQIGGDQLLATRPAIEAGDLDAADRLLLSVTDAGEMEAEKTAEAYFQRGKIAEEQVRWHDAAEHFERAAELSASYERLLRAGELLLNIGDYAKAERVNEDLVAIARTEYGNGDARTADALNNLAESYRMRGRIAEADALHREALQIRQGSAEISPNDVGESLNNLALLLLGADRTDEAEPMAREALRIYQETLGRTHTDTAVALNNLSGLLLRTGRAAEAEAPVREALAIRQTVLGDDHPDTAQTMTNLAVLLTRLGKLGEARPLYRDGLEIRRTALGDDHPEVIDFAARNYARFLITCGDGPEDEAELARLRADFGDDIGASED